VRRLVRAAAAAAAAAPGVRATAAGLRYALRAADARRAGTTIEPGVPTPEPSAGLVGAVALDTLLTLPMGLAVSVGTPKQYARGDAELDDAVAFYGDMGWLDDPSGRHPAPEAEVDGRVVREGRKGTLELLCFESAWRPAAGEPGGARWTAVAANQTVPVRLLRHEGEPRPWLIAVHGQGMGRPSDIGLLRVRRLHDELGLNIALPVLPMHGSRATGFAADRQFVSNTFLVNNVLGLTQAVWDLRRLLSWLRTDQRAPAIGMLGLSLGSYATSLLSTYEGDLACAVVVVPTADLAGALRSTEPAVASKRRLHRALHDDRSSALHSVVSPLARPCLVPRERRFIVAGQADRIAPPSDAARLWQHWEEPSINWRPRGHITTWRSSIYDDHLDETLTASGLRGPGSD
jgi:hypothetical protein